MEPRVQENSTTLRYRCSEYGRAPTLFHRLSSLRSNLKANGKRHTPQFRTSSTPLFERARAFSAEENLGKSSVLVVESPRDPRTAARAYFPVIDTRADENGRTDGHTPRASRSTEAHRTGGRWPEMTSLSCRSRGSERIDSRAALDRR